MGVSLSDPDYDGSNGTCHKCGRPGGVWDGKLTWCQACWAVPYGLGVTMSAGPVPMGFPSSTASSLVDPAARTIAAGLGKAVEKLDGIRRPDVDRDRFPDGCPICSRAAWLGPVRWHCSNPDCANA